MSTYEQHELTGVSPINQPVLPSESKHSLDLRRDSARLHRVEAKELREFNNDMAPFNKNKELTDALWNPRDIMLEQIKKWQFTNISPEEALHTPYAHFKYAA